MDESERLAIALKPVGEGEGENATEQVTLAGSPVTGVSVMLGVAENERVKVTSDDAVTFVVIPLSVTAPDSMTSVSIFESMSACVSPPLPHKSSCCF